MTLSEISEDDEIGVPYCFRIKAVNLCVQVAFTSEEEKTGWWKAIQKAIEEANKAKLAESDQETQVSSTSPTTGATAVEWVKDEQATMCAECCTEFTMINRRHHCRACGQVFCGTCSDYEAPIAYLGNKLQRVCEADYHLIYKGLQPESANSQIENSEEKREQSKPVQTGHLLWCQYKSYTWSSRPLSRPTLCASHIKHVKVNLAEMSDKMTGSRVSLEKAGVHTKSENSLVTPSTSGAKIDQKKESVNPPLPLNLFNIPVYMSRVFCVLDTDTLLSMFAARADARPREKLPLIGTRLFYLESAPTPDTPLKKARSSSCGTLEKTPVENGSPLFKFCSVPPSSTNGFSGPSSLSPNGKLMYRNTKPPPLNLSPNALQVENISPVATETKEGEKIVGSGDSLKPLREKLMRAAQDMKGSPPAAKKLAPGLLGVLEKLQARKKSIESPTEPVIDVEQQVESVSPLVRRMLRNQLGFILLPLTSDIIAYYFEAPSVEVRNRWINAIRHVCTDYINR